MDPTAPTDPTGGSVASTDEAVERLRALVDEAILPGSDRYTLAEVAERAGAEVETTRRLWRALGFPDPHPSDRIGGDIDVAVLTLAMDQEVVDLDLELMIQQTRIMSAAMNRITELWVDRVRVALASGDAELIRATCDATGDQDRTMWMLSYIHRRLLAAGLRRELANPSAGARSEQSAVFVDLVGFTTLTERVGPLELSRLIGSFEAIAYDTVAEHGGRVVKTIGDEVLFAADDPDTALDIAVGLVQRAATSELPPLRTGMDHGPSVWFEGDLYGSAVNRAARLVAEAPPGSIAAADSVRSVTGGRPWTELGVRHLKGVGDLTVHLLEVPAA